MNNKLVRVVGAGLAGCEASLTLARLGFKVELYDIKPKKFTPAHTNPKFAELVCSNSFKSDTLDFATGVLKEELRILGSALIRCADETKIPAGKTLTVDREKFCEKVTSLIEENQNITFFSKEIESFDNSIPTIIATGPLTTQKLSSFLKELFGTSLYFYDAVAPIIDAKSIDLSKVFIANKFDSEEGDYINCPLTKEQYITFVDELCKADRVQLKEFENEKVFEGCMPVEVMAKREQNALRCGPLKPNGLVGKDGRVPYACVQLRKENALGDAYNMVGFQTNLTFPEQKRVFSMVPGLENCEFLRYGVMHRNSYINAPKLLNHYFQLKNSRNTFFAGQISGIEGYVESIASGFIVAVQMSRLLNNLSFIEFTTNTALGALSNYLESANPNNFQPMHISYGLFNPINAPKDLKKQMIANRALEYVTKIKKEIF